MPIESLSLRRFRNLQPFELSLSPQLNVFLGDNAAGKTSILEALFMLARGRSFRTTQVDKLIQFGESDFQVLARLTSANGRAFPVGLQRAPGKLVCRIDGKPVKRLSELATLFPVHWVGGNLHTLVEDGPAYRRQFLDWGLFHVKPDYLRIWKRFNKALKQRNAALRTGAGARATQAWDTELAVAAERLHQDRKDYLDELKAALSAISPGFSISSDPIDIHYRKGWPRGAAYLETLSESLGKDQESGFTRAGPQRAELRFTVDGKPAQERLSRGQQKVFITTLHVAQAQRLYQETGHTSLFLLDDLGAELDSKNQQAILGLLGSIDAQVFVTAIEFPILPQRLGSLAKQFHVKHGLVSEVV